MEKARIRKNKMMYKEYDYKIYTENLTIKARKEGKTWEGKIYNKEGRYLETIRNAPTRKKVIEIAEYFWGETK